MKAIMLMFDSLNRHMLSSYGCQWTHTPNFKRLAEKCVTFDTSYVGSMPCMPARRELHTGRLNFLHRSWGPIEPFDDSMPQILKENGVYTHMISDHQHYWEDGGCTYHNRYNSWEIVRGQEGDCWKGQVKDPEIPEHRGRLWRQDVINRSYMDSEEKQPQSQVFHLGLEFLEKNKDADNWFVQIETFDPHEPFYTMQKYKELYPHEYSGPHFDWPEYGPSTGYTKEEIEHVRYEYAALMSMCDYNLGRLLDFMDANNMWEDTMLIVNTDHGYLLSEHDQFAKCVMPFYDELSHTPLFIYDPRLKIQGERRQSLVQTIDLAPTLLDYFHVEIPKDMEGKPLYCVIKDDTPVREAGLFGMHGQQICVTDGRYVYMRDPNEEDAPLYDYTHMAVHIRSPYSVEEMRTMEVGPAFSFTKGCPTMKIKGVHSVGFNNAGESIQYGTRLYDMKNDPKQLHPIEDKETEDRMVAHMVRLMMENDAPEEQYIRMNLQEAKERFMQTR